MDFWLSNSESATLSSDHQEISEVDSKGKYKEIQETCKQQNKNTVHLKDISIEESINSGSKNQQDAALHNEIHNSSNTESLNRPETQGLTKISDLSLFATSNKANKSETNQNETNQNETNQNGNNQNETNQNETNQNETNQNETNQNETNQSETNQNETNQNETNQSETNQNETNQSETNQNETNQNETNQNETNQNETNQNETNQNETNNEPNKIEYRKLKNLLEEHSEEYLPYEPSFYLSQESSFDLEPIQNKKKENVISIQIRQKKKTSTPLQSQISNSQIEKEIRPNILEASCTSFEIHQKLSLKKAKLLLSCSEILDNCMEIFRKGAIFKLFLFILNLLFAS